jgi:hypothetical protein
MKLFEAQLFERTIKSILLLTEQSISVKDDEFRVGKAVPAAPFIGVFLENCCHWLLAHGPP